MHQWGEKAEMEEAESVPRCLAVKELKDEEGYNGSADREGI